MNNKRLLVATATGLLLLGVSTPTMALDIGLGDGGSGSGDSGSGGADVSVGGADSSAGVTLGGSDTSIGSVSLGTGNNVDEAATLNIDRQDGALATVNRGDGSTDGNVNLGGVGGTVGGVTGGLPGLPGAGGGPGGIGGIGGAGGSGGGGGGGGFGTLAAFAALSPSQQQQTLNRCADVLARPTAYEPDLLQLCRLLATTVRH